MVDSGASGQPFGVGWCDDVVLVMLPQRYTNVRQGEVARHAPDDEGRNNLDGFSILRSGRTYAVTQHIKCLRTDMPVVSLH